MKNLHLISLVGLILAQPLMAMWFLNKTNEPRVDFIITMSNRKNESTKAVPVNSFTRKNVSFSEWQSQNLMNSFRVVVAWNSGRILCGGSATEGDADNYNAVLYRDAATSTFKCILRLNPPSGAAPE